MKLAETTKSRKQLEKIIKAFEHLNSFGTAMGKSKVVKLPDWMSLVPYFLAQSEPLDAKSYVIVHQEWSCGLNLEEPRYDNTPTGNKVRVGKGNVFFEHSLEKVFGRYEDRDMYTEKLMIEGEDVKIYTYARDGQVEILDFEMNKVGIGIFDDFSKEAELPSVKGYTRASDNGRFFITPDFDVNQGNFRETMKGMMALANLRLDELARKYHKKVDYLKFPSSEDIVQPCSMG